MNRQSLLSTARSTLAAAVLIAIPRLLPDAALAQGTGGTNQPSPAQPKKTIPEKVAPPEKAIPDPKVPDTGTSGQGETLTKKLERNEGVLHPSPNMDPEISVPAPNPNPGTTPVIPPPGSPGNPSKVRPK